MRPYPTNSPRALARVVAMAIVTDARLDHRELQVLDDLDAYAILGLTRAEFLEVVHQYCQDLLAEGSGAERIRLLDPQRIGRVLDEVTDPRLRVRVCGLLLNVCDADGRFHEAELAFLHQVLERWGLTLESLRQALAETA
ncbi:MAG TPA: TerB family tellurite resistance protein [Pelomicrobium sp.]|nr:TerB family tellurite resistance protein [Pelomicrobium sp.]